MSSVWSDMPIENYVESKLKMAYGSEGGELWAIYLITRKEVVDNILPWIAREEPNLTDHSARHIKDVMDNAAHLLGLPTQNGDEPDEKHFNADELLVLLMGLLLHDVGNIFGRERHNQRIADVWRSLQSSWVAWSASDRNLIIDIGRAHSGKNSQGGSDTLESLSTASRYFRKKPIRAGELAAVIRFADELAEGPQRTSRFLLEKDLIAASGLVYHHYASITQVSIDKSRGRVALTYNIDVGDSTYPREMSNLRSFMADLLKMTYSRAAKMNYERQFARHYAVSLHPYREVSISLNIVRDNIPIDLPLRPIILTDMTTLHDAKLDLEKIDSAYAIDNILDCLGLKEGV